MKICNKRALGHDMHNWEENGSANLIVFAFSASLLAECKMSVDFPFPGCGYAKIDACFIISVSWLTLWRVSGNIAIKKRIYVLWGYNVAREHAMND